MKSKGFGLNILVKMQCDECLKLVGIDIVEDIVLRESEEHTNPAERPHLSNDEVDKKSPGEAGGRETNADVGPKSENEIRRANGGANPGKTWIFQASPQFSDIRNAIRCLKAQTWLVQQFKRQIAPGDKVYLWECGPCGGIIGIAEVLEHPRIQPEPPEQIRFIRNNDKFSGDRLRVKLLLLDVIDPVIPRKYLLSRPELATLSILRCPRATNFAVSSSQARFLEQVVEGKKDGRRSSTTAGENIGAVLKESVASETRSSTQ